MAKLMIYFNDATYEIDESVISTNSLVSHLGTVAGEGLKVVVGGVEYSVGSDKVADVMGKLEVVLDGLMPAAGLYRTGSNYTELIVSWEDLLINGTPVINDGALSISNPWIKVLPPDLPEMNEYGFYYGVMYGFEIDNSAVAFAFYEDGSIAAYSFGQETQCLPAGSVSYALNSIDLSLLGAGIGKVSSNGTEVIFEGSPDGGGPLSTCIGVPLEGDLLLPDDGSITSIAQAGFSGSFALTGVVIPNGVISIGDWAFSYGQLTSVVIPNSVISIGSHAFYICDNLTSITIPNGVISIGVNAFHHCDGLINVSIPNSVTSIDNSAFSACTGLISVTISDGITSIGNWVFSGCTNLASITYTGTVEQWNSITIGEGWNVEVPATYVQCSDGQVSLV